MMGHEYDNEASPLIDITQISRKKSFQFYHELQLLVNIAIPTVIVQFSTFILYPQCASAIGRHLDTDSLGAYSLGSLSGNMTCVSILIGTLSASETLQPRSFGLGKYREVGLLAVRGFIVSLMSLAIPVTIMLTQAENVFDALGQDEEVGMLAAKWIHVYAWSVPPLILFRVTQRWLASQNIVFPCMFGAAIGSFLVHPIILKYAISRYGFYGSGWAISITQSVQYLLCLAYIYFSGEYIPQTWPGLNLSTMRDALNIKGLQTYLKLSFGGIFALSEWWFWEAICFLSGKFGVIDLCIHTVSYQLIPITFMVPLGVSIGLTVRMGVLLPVDVQGAKKLAAYTMTIVLIIGVLISCMMYKYQESIISLFTDDEEVIAGCKIIWFRLCIYNVLLYMFCMSRGILSALGLQWRTAVTMIICLWFIAIPTIVYCCINRGGGFFMMWRILPWTYVFLDIALTFCYVFADWEEIGARIKSESSIEN